MKNALCLALLCLLSLHPPCFAREFKPSPTVRVKSPEVAAAEQELYRLRSLLVQDEIDGYRLFYIPSNALTFIATKPGKVERYFEYQIVIRNTGYGSQKVKDLCNALEHTAIQTTTQTRGDFRWGCAFYKRNSQVAFISVDNGRKIAQINGVVVSMSGGMNQWMAQYLDAITAPASTKRWSRRKIH